MKLLDLQTDNYPKLGEDWLYGGEYIRKIPCEQVLYKTPHADPLINSICKKVGAVVYGGRYVLAQNTMCEYNIMYKITYADCISANISRNFEYDQNIYANVIKIEPQYFSDKFICKEKDYLQTIKRLHKIEDNTRIEILQVRRCGGIDIFEEYSKQLRNEPNKFDELNELLK